MFFLMSIEMHFKLKNLDKLPPRYQSHDHFFRLLLPLMQSFTQAGEFTTWGKLRSAMRDNIIYYTSYVVIAIVLVIYISLKPGSNLCFYSARKIR